MSVVYVDEEVAGLLGQSRSGWVCGDAQDVDPAVACSMTKNA
jgi:hypothetical protein